MAKSNVSNITEEAYEAFSDKEQVDSFCGNLPDESVSDTSSESVSVDSDSDSDSEGVNMRQVSESQANRPKRRKVGSEQQMISCLERLIRAVESRNARCVRAVSNLIDVPSIATVIGQMDEISELALNDKLYMFALDLFENKDNREIFSALKTNHEKHLWLKSQKEERDNKEQ